VPQLHDREFWTPWSGVGTSGARARSRERPWWKEAGGDNSRESTLALATRRHATCIHAVAEIPGVGGCVITSSPPSYSACLGFAAGRNALAGENKPTPNRAKRTEDGFGVVNRERSENRKRFGRGKKKRVEAAVYPRPMRNRVDSLDVAHVRIPLPRVSCPDPSAPSSSIRADVCATGSSPLWATSLVLVSLRRTF
jgi:hypothetical protein